MMNMSRNMKGGTLAVLVAVCLLLCTVSPAIINWNEEGFFADDGEDDKFVYVALGDSMVNGFGLLDYYPFPDSYKGQMSGGDVLPEDESTWNLYGLLQTPGDAYPTLLKNYLEDAGYDVNEDYMLAMSGMRSAELRSLLYDDFKDESYTKPDNRLGAIFGIEALVEKLNENNSLKDEIYIDSPESLEEYYRAMINSADLITYNFHYDFAYSLSAAVTGFLGMGGEIVPQFQLYLDESTIAFMEDIEAFVWSTIGAILEESGIDVSALPLDVVEGLVSSMVYVVLSYCINFDKNMEYIFENNKNGVNANVVIIDSYNFFEGVDLKLGNISIPLGDIFGYLLDFCNVYTSYISPYAFLTSHTTVDCPPTTYAEEFANYESLDKVSDDALAASFYTAIAWGGGQQPADYGLGYGNMNMMYLNPDFDGDNFARYLSYIFGSKDVDMSIISEDLDLMGLIGTCIEAGNIALFYPTIPGLNELPAEFIKVKENGEGGITAFISTGPCDFPFDELGFIRVPFYMLFGEAMMAHPSEIGHNEIFDAILENTKFRGDMDVAYFAGEPYYLLEEYAGINDLSIDKDILAFLSYFGISTNRLTDVANGLIFSDSADADDVRETLGVSNVVVADVNSGNMVFLLDAVYNYLSNPDYKLDYFKYSEMIGGEALTLLLALEEYINAEIKPIIDLLYIDPEAFVEAFKAELFELVNEFLYYHPIWVEQIVSEIVTEVVPILMDLYNKYPVEVEDLCAIILEEATPIIMKFMEFHPEGFMTLLCEYIAEVDAELYALLNEYYDVLDDIVYNAEAMISAFFDALIEEGYNILHSLDIMIFLMERVAYMQATTFEGMFMLDSVVKAINPLATTMYVGLDNPMSGITITVGGEKVPVGEILDLYAGLTNLVVKNICNISGQMVYVDSYVEYGPMEFALEDILAEISMFTGALASVSESEVSFIDTFIERMENHKAIVHDAVDQRLSNMEAIPVYDVYWENYDGVVLEADLNLLTPEFAEYDGAVPTRPSDEDFNYTFYEFVPSEDSTEFVLVYRATYTSVYNKADINVVPGQEDVEFNTADLGDKEYAKVIFDDISVVIPAEMFEGVTTASVSAKVVEASEIPGAIQAFTEGKTVLSLELFLDGVKTSDFSGNKVTISVNYDLNGEDASTLTVWYMNEDKMVLEKVDSVYQDGVLKITMDHFSYWVIGHEVVDDESDDSFPVAIAIMMVIIAGLCVALLRFKR